MIPTIAIHYRRPPGRVETYVQKLLLDAPHLKVTLAERVVFPEALRVNGRTVCESGADIVWFTFPGAWYDVGRFHLADGTFTGTYTNILTPPVFAPDGGWTTTDLFLDVWLDRDGEVTLLDENQLREAVQRGWIDARTAERARGEAEKVRRLALRGQWPPAVVEEWTLARARARARAGGLEG